MLAFWSSHQYGVTVGVLSPVLYLDTRDLLHLLRKEQQDDKCLISILGFNALTLFWCYIFFYLLYFQYSLISKGKDIAL